MDLLERYNKSTLAAIVKVRRAASGKAAVNYFDGVPRGQDNTAPDQYQAQFTDRPVGDMQVPLATAADATRGTWLPKALNYYKDLVRNNNLIMWRGKLIQQNNARKPDTYYTNENSRAPGVTIHSNS